MNFTNASLCGPISRLSDARLHAVLITLALLGALPAHAQSAPPVTVSALESAGVSVTNATAVPVTAFVLEWNLPVSAGAKAWKALTIKFYDAATEPLAAHAIPAFGSVTVPYGTGAQSAPQVLAVVFASGATWGDPSWTGRITKRRMYMQQSLVAALADLNAAAASASTTKESLIGQFQSAQASEQAGAANKDQQACIHAVRGIVLVNLRGQAPVGVVIAHEIGALQARLTAVQANAVGH